jgi:hypothetical protein
MADPTAALNKLINKQAEVITKQKEQAEALARQKEQASQAETVQPSPQQLQLPK